METMKTERPRDPLAPESSRILVVDDEEIIHVSLKRMLGRQGHRVEAVLDAREAVKRLAAERFDLVITDLMMPEINGLQLLERMTAEGWTVPVLMITGYPTIRTAVRALRLGAVDYLTKPFTRMELLGPVNRALRRGREAVDELPVTETPGDADGAERPEIALKPGDRFRLREHSWAVYEQDGTMRIGIEASFLEAVGTITTLELPEENDLVEQGFAGFRLRIGGTEQHNVFVPVTGQVVEVNREALGDPASIRADTWLVRVLPQRLDAELSLLLRS